MATTVQNFGVSSEKLHFSGSSQEDMGYAKTFWQSVQLLPPMESRLVSNDISQRLKAAPVGQQGLWSVVLMCTRTLFKREAKLECSKHSIYIGL